MAKDDYDVIVYRVLVYLYGCLKRKTLFDDTTFAKTVKKNVESEEYLHDVLRMMQEEGLIAGLTFRKIWGGETLLVSGLREARITSAGIHYLKDNSTMRKVGEALKNSADIIATLAAILL